MKPIKKTILLTGCSSGFGKLAVPLLLERGHTVIAALRGGESRLQDVFGAELKLYPGKLVALDLHLEKSETFGSALQLVEDRFSGKLDVLINNAGYGLFGSVEDQSAEQFRHQMEVNFFGPALLARTLMPALRQARGRVINVSSVAGLCSFPFYASYCASKFALEGLTEGMHFELKPLGVQVTLVEPGGFKTDFSTRSKLFGETSFAASSPYRARSQALSDFFQNATPRLGNPLRVSRLIVKLCEKRRIPLRTRIGADAGFMSVLRRWLPTGWRLALVDLGFRKAVFRE